MKKVLILTAILFVFSVSCGSNSDDTGDDKGNTANSADSVADDDTANTADSANSVDDGDMTDTANSANTGNTGNSADSGNTGDSANSSDTGDALVECIYNESNPDPCDNPGNTEEFPREYAGLHWSCPSENSMKWDAAQTYCMENNGRLPTISELRTLVRNCANTETGGACGLTDECFDLDKCMDTEASNMDGCLGCGEPYGKYNMFCDASDVTKSFFWSSIKTVDYIPSPLEMCFFVAEIRPCPYESTQNHVYCVQEK